MTSWFRRKEKCSKRHWLQRLQKEDDSVQIIRALRLAKGISLLQLGKTQWALLRAPVEDRKRYLQIPPAA